MTIFIFQKLSCYQSAFYFKMTQNRLRLHEIQTCVKGEIIIRALTPYFEPVAVLYIQLHGTSKTHMIFIMMIIKHPRSQRYFNRNIRNSEYFARSRPDISTRRLSTSASHLSSATKEIPKFRDLHARRHASCHQTQDPRL